MLPPHRVGNDIVLLIDLLRLCELISPDSVIAHPCGFPFFNTLSNPTGRINIVTCTRIMIVLYGSLNELLSSATCMQKTYSVSNTVLILLLHTCSLYVFCKSLYFESLWQSVFNVNILRIMYFGLWNITFLTRPCSSLYSFCHTIRMFWASWYQIYR